MISGQSLSGAGEEQRHMAALTDSKGQDGERPRQRCPMKEKC